MAFLQIALCEEGLPREGDEGEGQLRGVLHFFFPQWITQVVGSGLAPSGAPQHIL